MTSTRLGSDSPNTGQVPLTVRTASESDGFDEYAIEVAVHPSARGVTQSWIRQIVQSVLVAEEVRRADLTIALVDDAVIHQVNRDHLQHDYPTDVISFLYDCDPLEGHGRQDPPRGRGKAIDGELVVSTETAEREAVVYGWQSLDELTLYLVHGLLHLCGYDDQTESERLLMRDRERVILKKWSLSPHYGEIHSV